MRIVARTAALTLLALAGSAHADPFGGPGRGGGWDGGGWGRAGWGDGWGRDRGPRDDPRGADRSREGRVSVSRFVADATAAAALGHGAIAVSSGSSGADYLGGADRAAFEAAMVDRLIAAGYDTAQAQSRSGQVAELTVTRAVLVPAESRRSPVSGTAAIETGNRGTAYGLGIAVDMTKPLPALVSTRMAARIVDRASGKVLWEGRADIATREGDAKWTDQAIAAKLAAALLDGFPRASDGIARAD